MLARATPNSKLQTK